MFSKYIIEKCLHNVSGIFTDMDMRIYTPPNGIIRFINNELDSIYFYVKHKFENSEWLTGTLKFEYNNSEYIIIYN